MTNKPHRPAAESGLAALGLTASMAVALVLSLALGSAMYFPPVAGTAVIAFGMPRSPMARVRAAIGGHLIAAGAGLLAFGLPLPGGLGTAIVLATGVAFLAMLMSDTVHSPAGANPALMASAGVNAWELLPLLGVGLVAVLAIAAFVRRWQRSEPDSRTPWS